MSQVYLPPRVGGRHQFNLNIQSLNIRLHVKNEIKYPVRVKMMFWGSKDFLEMYPESIETNDIPKEQISDGLTSLSIPVRSSIKQFQKYIIDMKCLKLQLFDSSDTMIGKCTLMSSNLMPVASEQFKKVSITENIVAEFKKIVGELHISFNLSPCQSSINETVIEPTYHSAIFQQENVILNQNKVKSKRSIEQDLLIQQALDLQTKIQNAISITSYNQVPEITRVSDEESIYFNNNKSLENTLIEMNQKLQIESIELYDLQNYAKVKIVVKTKLGTNEYYCQMIGNQLNLVDQIQIQCPSSIEIWNQTGKLIGLVLIQNSRLSQEIIDPLNNEKIGKLQLKLIPAEKSFVLQEKSTIYDKRSRSKSPMRQSKYQGHVNHQAETGIPLHIHIEKASHIPLQFNKTARTEKNPTTKIKFRWDGQEFESNLVKNSSKPEYDFQCCVSLDDQNIQRDTLALNIEIFNDREQFLGQSQIKLAPLFYGLQILDGWYPILDVNRKHIAELKVCIHMFNQQLYTRISIDQDLNKRSIQSNLKKNMDELDLLSQSLMDYAVNGTFYQSSRPKYESTFHSNPALDSFYISLYQYDDPSSDLNAFEDEDELTLEDLSDASKRYN